MVKSYPEQLGEWVKLRKSTRRDKNLVAFLAVREDVKEAVAAGYAVKTVWTNMHESKRIEFGYDTFLNYVNRLIRRSQNSQVATIDSSHTKLANVIKKSTEKTTKSADSTGFTYNPVPNKEELL